MIKLDLGNIVTIGLMAFVGVWVIDRVLDKVGLGAWNTKNA